MAVLVPSMVLALLLELPNLENTRIVVQEERARHDSMLCYYISALSIVLVLPLAYCETKSTNERSTQRGTFITSSWSFRVRYDAYHPNDDGSEPVLRAR